MSTSTPSTGTRPKAYAIAYLREVDLGDAIVEYIQRIDETLAPYVGRFLVHGGDLTPAEGTWDGSVVIIEFPDTDAARGWYDSPDYQAILPLRTEHSQSIACIVEGVPNGYRAVDKLAALMG
ncbi:MAG TPA: DUF1330 domain-containing protein [Nocardioides sp.]|nr:DUF1330 domain-containing protein [Nocardioides sp.]